MKLIPPDIEAILPRLYSQENVPDPLAVIKFFDPSGRYTFYVAGGKSPARRRSSVLRILRLSARARLR
jgi:hypothetical protein